MVFPPHQRLIRYVLRSSFDERGYTPLIFAKSAQGARFVEVAKKAKNESVQIVDSAEVAAMPGRRVGTANTEHHRT